MDHRNEDVLPSPRVDPKRVFVIHGRDHETRDELFKLLRAYGLLPIEWDEAVHATRKAGPAILEVVSVGMALAQAVVVLLTPDDDGVTKLRYQLADDTENDREMSGQARLNVIFEAGRAHALFPERTIFLLQGQVRPFSDLAGVHMLRIGQGPRWRGALRQRLEDCGCDLARGAMDWMDTGDFDGWVASHFANYRERRHHFEELLDRDELRRARELAGVLGSELVAYCLISACQFDYDIQYWLHRAKHDEATALILAQFIIVSPEDHERPPYRAARALELFPELLRSAALSRVRERFTPADLSPRTQEILEAIGDGSVMELVRTTSCVPDDLRLRLLEDLRSYRAISISLD